MNLKKTISLLLAILMGAAFTVPAFAYSFSDIDGYWGATFVEEAYEKGIVSGYNDGSFKPEREVNYQEAATMICNTIKSSGYKALSLSVQSKYSAEFKALGADADWVKAYLSALFGEGAAVIADFRNGKAQGVASSSAQRQVIGAWAVRMLGIPVSPLCDVSAFSDASSIAPAYLGETDALLRHSIMSGYTNGTFRPENIVKRGEFATVCVNMLGCIEELEAKEGKHKLEDSLFLKTGYIQEIDNSSRSLTFSFGDTYTVPEGASIVTDGKAAEFKDLASYVNSRIIVSYVKDQESALIIQTAPMVESGKLKSVSTEGDFWLLGILTSSGLTVNYVLPMDSGVKLPSVGTRLSFIAEGTRILELK